MAIFIAAQVLDIVVVPEDIRLYFTWANSCSEGFSTETVALLL